MIGITQPICNTPHPYHKVPDRRFRASVGFESVEKLATLTDVPRRAVVKLIKSIDYYITNDKINNKNFSNIQILSFW